MAVQFGVCDIDPGLTTASAKSCAGNESGHVAHMIQFMIRVIIILFGGIVLSSRVFLKT